MVDLWSHVVSIGIDLSAVALGYGATILMTSLTIGPFQRWVAPNQDEADIAARKLRRDESLSLTVAEAQYAGAVQMSTTIRNCTAVAVGAILALAL